MLVVTGPLARAQYQPIPNFTGPLAGQELRNAINNRFSGVTPISPTYVPQTFAQLSALTEQNGQFFYCTNCLLGSSPCAGSGSGSPVLGINGHWACSLGGNTVVTPLNGLPAATGNYPMGGNKLTGLANGAASGDTMAYGQPAGGDLSGALPAPSVAGLHFGATGLPLSSTAPGSGQCLQSNGTQIVGSSCGGGGQSFPPSGNLPMGGNKLTGLANGAASGDTMAYGQPAGGDLSGALPAPQVVAAHLGSPLPAVQGGTGLGAVGSNGQCLTSNGSAMVWGACGGGGGGGTSVITSPAYGAADAGGEPSTSCSFNVPKGAISGNTTLFTDLMSQASETNTPPAGWTLVGSATNQNHEYIYSHLYNSGDTVPYVFSGTANYFGCNIVAVDNLNTSTPVDTTATTTGNDPLLLSNPTLAKQGELVLVFGVGANANGGLTATALNKSILWSAAPAGVFTAAWHYVSYGTPSITITDSSSAGSAVIQVALNPAITNTGNPVLYYDNAVLGGVESARPWAPKSTGRIKQFSLNGEFNPLSPPYNAVCSGNSQIDDTLAIQNAVNAACAAQIGNGGDPEVTPVVQLPFGSCYTTKPILVVCPAVPGNLSRLTLRGEGYQATQLIMKGPTGSGPPYGPAIFVVPANYISFLNSGNGITGASLATGSGVSLYHSATNELFSLDVTAGIGAKYANGDTVLDARGYVKPTGGVGSIMEIQGSFGTRDYAGSNCHSASGILCDGAFNSWKGTDEKLYCQFTTSVTGDVVASSSGTMSQNNTQETECVYDGAHVAAALNGVWGASVAATGTIVQRADEVTSVSMAYAAWPHIGNGIDSFMGYIDSVELGRIAYHAIGTNYTPDTAKFVNGGDNPHYLFNFDLPLNMPGTTQPVMFAADYAYNPNIFGSTSGNAWAPIYDENIGCCGGHYFIEGLTVSSGAIAIDAEEAEVTVSHVQASGQGYMGVHTGPAATYGTVIDDLRANPSSSSIGPLVLEGGINTVHKLYTTCGVGCDYIRGALEYDGFVNPQGNTLFGTDFINYGYHIVLDDDTENSGTFSALRLQSDPVEGYGQFVVDGGNIAGSNAAPVRLVPGGDRAMRVVMHAPVFLFNGSSAVFDTSAVIANFETVPIFVDGAAALPGGVSWTSNSNWPLDIHGPTNFGSSQGLNLRYSVAGTALPTCNTANDGDRRCVSDATACTNGTTYTGSSSTKCLVWCNGASSTWTESGSGC